MANLITSFQDSLDGNSVFYLDSFKKSLEAHLSYIQASPDTETVSVLSTDKKHHLGDFYQLLAKKFNMPKYMWWITMRLNGLHSPADYVGQFSSIKIPSQAILASLVSRHQSTTSFN